MDNVINTLLLKIFLYPAFIYTKYGVDLRHLKAILTTKLIMDDRRPSGFQRRNRESKGEVSTATLLTMFVSLLMGAFFLVTFQITEDVTRFTAYFSLFMIMLSLFLITDFTYVLIDVKDNYIILPKPVTPATFLAARLLHIIIHVVKIIVPLSLPGLIATGISRGIWGAVIFVPIMGLVTLFTLFIVNAAYLFILKIFSPEKFKSIITSVQIGFTIVLYASFQVVPRMLENFNIYMVDARQYWFAWLIPSFWFAGAWKFAQTFLLDPGLMASTLLSLVMPFVSIWIVIRYFAPTFHRKLSLIASGSAPENKTVAGKLYEQGMFNNFISNLARLLTRPGVERGAFLFTWKFTARSREFKMKIYPQFGYMFVLLIILFFRTFKNDYLVETDGMKSASVFQILSVIYLCSFVYIGSLFQFPFSENFKASWIFYSAPVDKPGKIISGAIKTGILKFCVPMIIIVFAIVIYIEGISLIPNLIFGFANVLMLCVIMARIIFLKLPFSLSPKNASDASTSATRILIFFIIPVCAIPHYFVFDYPMLTGILTVVPLTAVWLILKNIQNISWDKVNAAEE